MSHHSPPSHNSKLTHQQQWDQSLFLLLYFKVCHLHNQNRRARCKGQHLNYRTMTGTQPSWILKPAIQTLNTEWLPAFCALQYPFSYAKWSVNSICQDLGMYKTRKNSSKLERNRKGAKHRDRGWMYESIRWGSQKHCRGSQLWLQMKNHLEKILVVSSNPDQLFQDHRGWGSGISTFSKLPRWFSHATRFENHWLKTRTRVKQ